MFLNMARDREFGLGDLLYFFRNHPDRVIVAGFVLALIDLVVSIPYYWYSYTVIPGEYSGSTGGVDGPLYGADAVIHCT